VWFHLSFLGDVPILSAGAFFFLSHRATSRYRLPSSPFFLIFRHLERNLRAFSHPFFSSSPPIPISRRFLTSSLSGLGASRPGGWTPSFYYLGRCLSPLVPVPTFFFPSRRPSATKSYSRLQGKTCQRPVRCLFPISPESCFGYLRRPPSSATRILGSSLVFSLFGSRCSMDLLLLVGRFLSVLAQFVHLYGRSFL